MKTETEREQQFTGGRGAAAVTCPSCGTELARGMRFCRLCGYRLGEGLEEYVETVRLNAVGGFGVTPGAGAPPAPMTRSQAATTTALYNAPAGQAAALNHGGRRRKKSRLRWLALPVVLTVALTGGVLFVSDVTRDGSGASASAPVQPRSFFGAGDLEYIDGEGLLMESVLPGGPAEAAGLRDGDVLVKVDGRPITAEGDLRAILRTTPIGKTVEVEFVRDGESRRVPLTTIAPGAYDPRAFDPPGGSGYWGVGNLRRVAVPGANFYGVQLGDVSTNRPADIAGLKEDDIVLEFGGRPVRTTEGLRSYINHTAPGTTVNVAVIRDGQRLGIPVKMGKD
jgi:hypothetical protein